MSPIRFMSSVLVLAVLVGTAVADDWLPVTKQELELTESHEKGAHAVILYREFIGDDVQGYDLEYFRIKILSDEGKKYGDIEIPFPKHAEVALGIGDIRARTIRPDGTVVPFRGEIFEKVLYKGKKGRYFAKTFTMPEVEKGSIIEYKFARRWHKYWLISTRWTIQSELPTRKLHLFLNPNPALRLNWETYLPPGVLPEKDPQGRYTLDMENVPGLKREEWMPPEDLYKFRVHFFYSEEHVENSPQDFWRRMGKKWNGEVENFIGDRAEIRQEVQRLVAASDTPQAKLQKIYARVQGMRNLSYEREKEEKELQREKRKPSSHAAEVLQRGNGDRNELTRLFVAMARAAGFDAAIIRVSNREDFFFNSNSKEADQVKEEIAVLRLEGGEMYLDPGTRFCPFGLLAWQHTATQALRLDKKGGTFFKTLSPASKDAMTERKATLRLGEDGSLEGTLQITMTGREALEWRLDTIESDDTGRRKQMENELLRSLPGGAIVEVKQIAGWDKGGEPLRAEATVRVPGMGAFTGRRWILPLGFFQVSDKNPFQVSERKYPVYFPYTFQEYDEVRWDLLPGLVVETVPAALHEPTNLGRYEIRTEPSGRAVVIKRQLSIDGIGFDVPYYQMVRTFFTNIRAGDENQLVLRKTEISQR